jgi:molybdopterin molybdotransferase
MINVDEALALIGQHLPAGRVSEVPLEDSLGHVLAEEIASDIDSPPYDKAMVDGYAVVSDDLADGRAELEVLEEITAGKVPTCDVGPGRCSRVMTGAPIPRGCDAMIMIERSELIEDTSAASPTAESRQRVRLEDAPPSPGAHILNAGTIMRQGDVVLHEGDEIRPMEIGLLAEVGHGRVKVFDRPRVAILATGDELVSPEQRPQSGQIRNSNGPMLCAAVRRHGGQVLDLGVARDRRDALVERITAGLEADMLVLSGGVSAGVLDLVPGVLAEMGVKQVFHKVRLKPGKPLWFGVRSGGDHTSLVFGLPGNPVSSLVCFELFVRPVMAALSGHGFRQPPRIQAALAQSHQVRGDRPTFFPARVQTSGHPPQVALAPWKGSSDLRGLAGINALAYFPAGERAYTPGEMLEVILL